MKIGYGSLVLVHGLFGVVTEVIVAIPRKLCVAIISLDQSCWGHVIHKVSEEDVIPLLPCGAEDILPENLRDLIVAKTPEILLALAKEVHVLRNDHKEEKRFLDDGR